MRITHPNVDIFLGGSLKELEAYAVCQLLAAIVGNHPLVLHVALVANQHNLGVVPAVGLDLCAPGSIPTVSFYTMCKSNK